MAILLVLVGVSASDVVCVDDGRRRDVGIANDANGGVVSVHGVIYESETLIAF